jgi:hypothetical protein
MCDHNEVAWQRWWWMWTVPRAVIFWMVIHTQFCATEQNASKGKLPVTYQQKVRIIGYCDTDCEDLADSDNSLVTDFHRLWPGT